MVEEHRFMKQMEGSALQVFSISRWINMIGGQWKLKFEGCTLSYPAVLNSVLPIVFLDILLVFSHKGFEFKSLLQELVFLMNFIISDLTV